MDRREFLRHALAGGAALGVAGVAGLALAQDGVRITRHGISPAMAPLTEPRVRVAGLGAFGGGPGPATDLTPGPGLATALHRPLRIAQLTDIHVGWGTSAETLRAAQLQARLVRPDLLVLTGDYLNHSLTELDALRDWVRGLPRPAVATLGNHDYWSGALAIRRMLEQEGIPVLTNESLELTVAGLPLQLVGVDDGFTHRDDVDRAFRQISDPARTLVLSHEPKTADRIARTGARVILSGHTHGGQFDIPGVTAALATVAGLKYLKGWYLLGETRLYVNAGVGSSVAAGRNGTASSELAVFDIG